MQTASVDQFGSVATVYAAADRNLRHRRRMEDAHIAVDKFCDNPSCGFFAVFDGHANATASTFCKNNFAKHLEDYLKGDYSCLFETSDENDPKIEEMWTKLYAEMDKAIFDSGIPFAGCTAVTALSWKNPNGHFFSVANAGDAQCVLCSEKEARLLTVIHNTTNPDEVKLVEEKSGFVKNGRVNGMLEVTRSLGDNNMKLFITSIPAVKTIKITDEIAAVLACDGVWDVITPELASKFVNVNFGQHSVSAASASPEKSKESGNEEGAEKKPEGSSLSVLSTLSSETQASREIPVNPSENVAKSIISAAIKNGSTDNVTCMVVRF